MSMSIVTYDLLLTVFIFVMLLLVFHFIYLYRRFVGKRERVRQQVLDLQGMVAVAQEIMDLHASNAAQKLDKIEQSEEVTTRFKQIFSQALVAISFYDKKGYFIDMNKKMRELINTAENEENFFTKAHLSEYELIKDDFDLNGNTGLHACQHLCYPVFGIDKYIEFRVHPVFDNNELKYYIMTARDITSERELFIGQKKAQQDLLKANEKINEHEDELNYLLNSGGLWVWHSDMQQRTITFSRSLKHADYVETFDEFEQAISHEDYESSMKEYNNLKGTENNLNRIVHFTNTPLNNGPMWASITGIPTHDEQGVFTGHIGIVRDVTMLMKAQEKLLKETARAENSGKLKSTFLANMTHEIRTPLNAIVGFSDLLQEIKGEEDRKEFIHIIRNNCDMLIRLIDDIIEASNMNNEPLRINAVDVDFAQAFQDICQTLSQRVQNPNVQFIAENPYKQFLTHVDQGRLQQVITNFTTNAVKYTHEGHIKVGYRYENGGIYMYCEDTGAGIPADKQDAVFERFVKLNDFVQGTGLGLSICKNIAEACGGKIGVSSQGENQGSLFWIWIPCECRQSVPA